MNQRDVAPATHSLAPEGSAPRSGSAARLVLVLGLVATIGLGGFIGVRVKQAVGKRDSLQAERASAQASAQVKPPSKVAHPEPTRYRPHVDIQGTLRPWREADLGFPLGGRLVRVPVSAGDHVKERQLLAVLDGSGAEAQLGQAEAAAHAAEAQLALAEDNLKRSEALIATKSIPEAQAEHDRQQVALAKAQLEGARAASRFAATGAGDHSLVAPFDGVVTRAPTAAGAVMQPGVTLVRVEDLTRFRLSATLGEDEVVLVRPGAEVAVETRDRRVTGRVTTVVPSLDQATRRAPVEIEVPNDPKDPILAYGFVRASIDSGKEIDALRIPSSARRPGSQDDVVKVENGKAHVVSVLHSVDTDGTWLVRKGLAPTDVLLLDPDPETKDGDPIGPLAP